MKAAANYSTLKVDLLDGGVACVSLNRPKKLNSMNLQMMTEIVHVMSELEQDDNTKVVVLRGEGKHFCAGLEFDTFLSVADGFADASKCPGATRSKLMKTIKFMQDSCTAFEKCSKPVIAAIQGACVGAGVDAITACDIRLCCESATFCVKEVDLGITADMGTLQRLPGIVGEGRARELALTARTMSSSEALSIGLVTEVVPTSTAESLKDRVVLLAKSIAAKPALATAGTKRVMVQRTCRDINQGLDYVAAINGAVLYSHDLQAALADKASRPTISASKL